VCFPYAGGSATVFHSWPNQLPPEIEVWTVHPPGRGPRIRDKAITNLDTYADQLSDALRAEMVGGKPFAFFGHSMGALVAFEVARRLRALNDALPVMLLASGRRAPHLPSRRSDIHALSDDELLERIRALNGTPAAVLDNADLMQLLIPALRADFQVCETYTFEQQAPLSCPIVVYGGLDDEEAPRDMLEAWQEHARTPIQLRMFPGDHFFLHAQQANVLHYASIDLMHAVQMAALGGI
jgi:medium-chain acyl-[acyl-carrier-protein] hydrolase